ncbi:hypothetical protein KY309_01685 [Candidatus Woesearchaeota archaeon]|nr:hypothetical protein [Candidatus Woesearchaeota archaeon]
MKKIILLLLLISCTQIQEETTQPEITPEPVHQPPIIIEQPARPPLHDNINTYIVKPGKTFTLTLTDAIYDNFSIIPAERYDALYQSDITVLVHVFKFSTREELDVVMKSEFYDIINLGTSRHQGHTIAIYLNQDNHRAAVWTSGNFLIYVETYIPDFVEREIADSYLLRYPSDLKTDQCIDSDGDDHLGQGTTTRVKLDSTIIEFTDVCLRDFALYKNKQYTSKKGLSEEDGLLEGQCHADISMPGYIEEYACHRGCENGVCRR